MIFKFFNQKIRINEVLNNLLKSRISRSPGLIFSCKIQHIGYFKIKTYKIDGVFENQYLLNVGVYLTQVN